MPQKLNLMKEEMDFFHFFHEANGKPKALNSIFAPVYVKKDSWKAFAEIRKKKPFIKRRQHKSNYKVQTTKELSVFEYMKMVDSKRRAKGIKKDAGSVTRTIGSTLGASTEDPDNEQYQFGLRNGFLYFKGFAINTWIMIYVVRVRLPNTFIAYHLDALLESAKRQGIPLGMPYIVRQFCYKGKKLAQETKEKVVDALTIGHHKRLQMAMIYAPKDIDLMELTAEIASMVTFPIISGCIIANYDTFNIMKGLRSFVEVYKKLPVMGIATRIHDGYLMIARCLNQPETGAKFDKLSFHGLKLAILQLNRLSQQAVSMHCLWDYFQNKSLDEVVIYRSDVPSYGRTVFYQTEIFKDDIQILLEQSRIRFTYIVVEIASASNQPTFDIVFNNISFTDSHVNQLTAEASFWSEKKGIPAPLAMAQICVTRMVDHYNGFKENENYSQVAQVKQGLDKEAYKVVKTYFRSYSETLRPRQKSKLKRKAKSSS